MQIDVSDDDEDEQVKKHSKQNETRALGRHLIVLGLVLRVGELCVCVQAPEMALQLVGKFRPFKIQ
jgi:hypothetical protein